MSRYLWWEDYPQALAEEERALTKAGLVYRRDEAAYADGVLRWTIEIQYRDQTIPLTVTFPELYPYFRFHVSAPDLGLPHHQSPLDGTLCLLGRASSEWNVTDTVADLIQTQLPILLRTGAATDRESVRGLEQRQAEPASAYFPYPASLVAIPAAEPIPPEHTSGIFTVAVNGPLVPPPDNLLRGLLVEVRGQGDRVIFRADERLTQAFTGTRVSGVWVRTPEPILEADQGEFLKQLLSRYPATKKSPRYQFSAGHFRLSATVFPEEAGWRNRSGEGWLFLCEFVPANALAPSPMGPGPARGGKSHSKGKKR